MAGTIPLKSQVPDNEPIKSKISMAGIDELMLSCIPSKSSFQVNPKRIPTKQATEAERIKIIWLEPRRASPLKIETLTANAVIRKNIGIKDSNKVGFRVISKVFVIFRVIKTDGINLIINSNITKI